MKKLLVLVLVLSVATNILYGQRFKEFVSNDGIPENVIENVALFTDRDIYLSGENIWFSSYCYLNDFLKNTALSSVLYLEIYNKNNNSIIKRKFKISDGVAYGSLKIPEETPSGNYFIRAYTQYLRNFSSKQFFTSFITIINPEVSLNTLNNKSIDTINKDTSAEKKIINPVENNILGIHHNNKLSFESININLSVNKEKFSPRELVDVTLIPNFINQQNYALLSFSVVKHGTLRENDSIIPEYLIDNPQLLNSYLLSSKSNHDLFSLSKSISESLFEKIIISENIKTDSKYKDYKKYTWIPENRDITISGTVYDKNTKKPLSNQQVFISVLGDYPQFHINATRENGEFIFSLNNLTDMNGVLISMKQWKDYQPEFLVNNDFLGSFDFENSIPLEIDSTKRNFLEEMFVNYQITQLYGNKEKQDKHKKYSIPISFGEVKISIVLADYIELPSFKDIIREIVPYTRLNKKDGRYSLIVSNSKTIEVYRDPLILLDNIPVFNVNELMKINPKKIIKIEVIDKQYVYGDYTINGIIRVVTNTDNFADYDFSGESVYVDFQTITASTNPIFPEYNSEIKRNDRIPDFRNSLYWKPKILLTDKNISLSFYTSDHCSKYDIIVRGISYDGKACFGKKTIEVVK